MSEAANIKELPLNLKDSDAPEWAEKKTINEAMYCASFIQRHKLIYTGDTFFTTEGKMSDENILRKMIYEDLKVYAESRIPQTISNIVELLKLEAYESEFEPETDRVHVKNGTLYLDGYVSAGKTKVVRIRLPISYNFCAPKPTVWLSFLNTLLYPEDILTLQEFLGYCLIPSNKGQRMMIIKGNGGEGKSQIGAVMKAILGSYVKDGSVKKVSENKFARADLENTLLCIDDDLSLAALKHTNYIKSIVTAQDKMDLEKKNKQSYQGYMYARLLAFSNGDLQAIHDNSNGFYRRQIILTTRELDEKREDDPFISEKMIEEIEGIFSWIYEGLKRLVANKFRFTISDRTKENLEKVKRGSNNIAEFMESTGYIRFGDKKALEISARNLYGIYEYWCDENAYEPMKKNPFVSFLKNNEKKYDIVYDNNVGGAERVRGFHGIGGLVAPYCNNIGKR